MGDITINGKNIITQSGAAEPVIASNVTGGAGLDAGDAGTLTGVLPVGVTGGSGLTALGTVTAGNLANTAIVYPAGHIVQTIKTISTAQITFASTNNTYSDILPAASITLTNSANAVLVSCDYNFVVGGGHYPAIKVAVWWSIAGGAQNAGLVTHFTAYAGISTDNDYGFEPILHYHLPATSAQLTYRLVGSNTSGSTYTGTYVGHSNPTWAGHKSTMILQEIQV